MQIEVHQLAAVSTNSNVVGIPVIFLHGMGGSIFFWTPDQTALFDQMGPCYSLSLPSHYPAILPLNFGVECLTAELIAKLISGAILEIVGSQKVLLLGHSTGGFAALSTAIYAPEVVGGVICIAGFAKDNGQAHLVSTNGSFGKARSVALCLSRYISLVVEIGQFIGLSGKPTQMTAQQ